MMLRPAINNLLNKITTEKHVGTRYELVIAVAKRARDVNDCEKIKMTAANSVSYAVKEIDDGKVKVSIPEAEEKAVVLENTLYDADTIGE